MIAGKKSEYKRWWVNGMHTTKPRYIENKRLFRIVMKGYSNSLDICWELKLISELFNNSLDNCWQLKLLTEFFNKSLVAVW